PLTTGTDTVADPDTIVVDSRLTFQEAIAGTKAPDEILDQLVLIDVVYRSTDLKVHQGQILTNKKIEEDIREIFTFMLENNFVVEKAIPVVAYDWNDSLSMADNNSYSFCYRNISYSKHAKGLAIDINPRLNPLRWKNENRPNQPVGAVRDTTVNGTLYPGHVVVEEFKRRGFRWGHTFSKYYDDHHFEKQ
ncbi:M15 family metallopeptidase, partial [Petrimonas mucosa]